MNRLFLFFLFPFSAPPTSDSDGNWMSREFIFFCLAPSSTSSFSSMIDKLIVIGRAKEREREKVRVDQKETKNSRIWVYWVEWIRQFSKKVFASMPSRKSSMETRKRVRELKELLFPFSYVYSNDIYYFTWDFLHSNRPRAFSRLPFSCHQSGNYSENMKTQEKHFLTLLTFSW